MTDLEKIGKKVLSKTSITEEQKFGSVLAILMIIGIIVNVVRAIQECEKNTSCDLNNNQQTTFFLGVFRRLSLKRGWGANMKLKKILRQNLPVADYRMYKTEIQKAILEVGEKINEQETFTLMEAANND